MDFSVYVVDTDPAIYQSLRKAFPSVRWFANMETLLDCLSAADARDTDRSVVVVEAHLGETDGVELIERLREGGRRLPVIVVCRDADVPTAVRAMQLGAADFFARPLLARSLVKRIRALTRSP